MKSEVLIHEVKLITQYGIEFVKKKLTHLAPNQLNWKPSSSSWNITEILAHLNSYTSFYNSSITERLSTTRHTTPAEDFIHSPLGKSAWKSMRLGKEHNVKRRFKSPKEFDPTLNTDLISENEIADYIQLQEEFIKITETSKNYNLRRVKTAISISKIIKLRLGDVLLFIAYHHERHIHQILAILQNKNFPSKSYD
jgi:uncharacterized damage-inducible protein DinB